MQSPPTFDYYGGASTKSASWGHIFQAAGCYGATIFVACCSGSFAMLRLLQRIESKRVLTGTTHERLYAMLAVDGPLLIGAGLLLLTFILLVRRMRERRALILIALSALYIVWFLLIATTLGILSMGAFL